MPSGSTVTGNNTGNEPEFVNVGDISTGSISLGTIDKSNAQIYMYAQDRMGTTGTFSGYIAPSSFSFTLTGPATQNLIDYLAYSAESAADFAAQGITVSNGILTWDGTRTTPGFFDNNGDADTPLWGNGLACEAFGLTGSNAYTAPFRVRDLAGTRAGNTVSLSWTAPGKTVEPR